MEGGLKVWVNGAFDVLHIGHIKLLETASKYGRLRVGIDSDERIRQLKGENRPFNTLQDRMDFLRSIKYVHDVVSFDTEEELVEQIKSYAPQMMVIGSDYKDKRIIGAEWAGVIYFFDRIENKSTTSILTHETGSNR